MTSITNDTEYRSVILRIQQLQSMNQPDYRALQELHNLQQDAVHYEFSRYDFTSHQVNTTQGKISA